MQRKITPSRFDASCMPLRSDSQISLAEIVSKLEASLKHRQMSVSRTRTKTPVIESWADAINTIDRVWEQVFGSPKKGRSC